MCWLCEARRGFWAAPEDPPEEEVPAGQPAVAAPAKAPDPAPPPER
jgi:hypothetical protein